MVNERTKRRILAARGLPMPPTPRKTAQERADEKAEAERYAKSKAELAAKWERINNGPMRTVTFLGPSDWDNQQPRLPWTGQVPDLSLVVPPEYRSGNWLNNALYWEVRDYCNEHDIPFLHDERWPAQSANIHLIVCENIGDQVILKTVFPDLR